MPVSTTRSEQVRRFSQSLSDVKCSIQREKERSDVRMNTIGIVRTIYQSLTVLRPIRAKRRSDRGFQSYHARTTWFSLVSYTLSSDTMTDDECVPDVRIRALIGAKTGQPQHRSVQEWRQS